MSNSLQPHELYSPWNSLGQNTEVGSCSLLQGIFLTQGLNPALSHYRWILYQLSCQGSPTILEWVAYPFSRGSSRPRNRTGVSCIAQPSHQGSPYTCTPVFTRAMTQQQPKCPSTEEWSNKMWYTHNGILLSHEKEQSWVCHSDAEEPRVCRTQWRRSEGENQILYYSRLHMESGKTVLMNLSAGQEYRCRRRGGTGGHSGGRRR